MADKNDKYTEPIFPAPYEYFEELIADNIQLRQELENELKKLQQNYRPPKAYTLDYKMPGFSEGGPGKSYDIAIEKLQNQIKEIENKIEQRINIEIKALEPKPDEEKRIKEVVYEKMYPDPFKDKGKYSINALTKKSKSIEEAQYLAYYDLKRFKKSKLNKDQKKDNFSPERE